MASIKRERSVADEPEAKKAKAFEAEPSEQLKTKQLVVLNPADCDLDFNIEGNGLQGSALYENGFAYCWSGARANVGITGGKYCFSCKIISAQPVDKVDTPLDQQHICRLGISRGDDKVGNLGETVHSFGFGGTGKFSNAGKFCDYGEKYGVGDTILCTVNLETKPMASISFAKNGKWLGTAKHFNAGPNFLGVVDSPIRQLHWESAVYPHVLLKNVVVQLQFSFEDGLVPEEGYKPWASAIEDGNAIMGPMFSDLQDCEVLMMVGLPASGKTTWAEKWVNEHPERRYVLLGTNLALDQMKVPGLLRKQNYGERFDRLMDCAIGIFNTMLSRASKTPRNFIIDQTNVYKNARKRKLKPFANYQKIAVVVFPKPEDLKFRGEKRFGEMGKEVPAETLNEMLANFVLPKSKDMPVTDEYFDQVIFVELNRAESQRYLDEMKASLDSKSGLSPYSRESSIQSYNSTSMQYSPESSMQPYSSSPVQYPCESSIQSFNSTPVQYSRESSIQSYNNLSFPYQSTSSDSGHWQSSLPYQPMLTPPYGNYSINTFLPTADFNHRRSYIGYDQSGRNDIETRTTVHVGVSDLYQSNQTYGVGDNYYPANSGSSNFSPGGATNNYQSGLIEPPSFTNTTYGGSTCVPGGSQVDLPAPSQPTVQPAGSNCVPGGFQVNLPTPSQPTVQPAGSNCVPRGSQVDLPAPSQPTVQRATPTPYGSYGTPNSRPSYGNYPMSAPHPGGYAPPRPGYY